MSKANRRHATQPHTVVLQRTPEQFFAGEPGQTITDPEAIAALNLDGQQVAPPSRPLEPAEPGPDAMIPAEDLTPAQPSPETPWPRDCTVEIPLCLLGERRFNDCQSEEEAIQRYLTLGGIRGSKHLPIVRPLQSLTLE